MDRESLRAAQAPLRERYRAEPATALAALDARAAWTEPGITCTVDGWAGPVRAGLHTATGGDGSDACSADMLLQALLGCAGVTMRSVATVMGLDVRSAAFTATSAYDARGTLGVDRDVPVGIRDVLVTAVLDTDASDADLARLATSTERYCVVGRSLNVPVRVVVERVA
ncbi:MAG: OsmC family protein [Propionibacteriaceae bacterium]|nr:OsmC family protein [Propionibacteriaceae bacterium]